VKGFVDDKSKNAFKLLTWGERMAKKKMSLEEQIEKGLTDLAFGSCCDAVRLLFMTEEETMQKLPKLKLINVSEIKRPKGGGMEIKFFDRIKAFEKLIERDGEKQENGLSFYEALEKSAQTNIGENNDG